MTLWSWKNIPSLLQMSTLQRACKGASAKKGGLNVKEFKMHLIERFPEQKKVIQKSKRKELQDWCASNVRPTPPPKPANLGKRVKTPTTRKYPIVKKSSSSGDLLREICTKGGVKRGVLNIKEIRNELAAKYPDDADEIMNAK